VWVARSFAYATNPEAVPALIARRLRRVIREVQGLTSATALSRFAL
jgi:hypothetical protein